MKLFDRAGKPVEVPDEHVPAAVASGQFGAPAGTRIPVRVNGVVGSVPVEDLHAFLANGASLSTFADYEQADLQAKYGDTAHQALAAGTSFASAATLGLSDAAISGLGKGARETVRKSEEANPVSSGLGTVTGIAVPIAADILSGGAATPAVAAAGERALAKAGERALARAGGHALAETGERALAPTVVEGMLEAAPRRLPAAAEELAGEVVHVGPSLPGPAPRMLPSPALAESAPVAEAAPRALPGIAEHVPPPIADAEFETLGGPLQTVPHPQPTIADLEAKAINDVRQAVNAHAPVTPELTDAVAKTAVRDVAPTAEAYGKSLIREAVETSLLGPQRLVQGGGQAVENAVRKILGAEAETALGRIAQKTVAQAARGAFEGGVYGVSNEAGHQWLQDDPTLNGERLAAAWAHGALLGTAFGSGLGLAGGAGREALTKAVGKEGISSYLLDKSGEMMWHAAGPTKTMTAEAERYAGGVAKVGNLIREDAEKIMGRTPKSREELLELAGKMKELHEGEIDGVLQRLDAKVNQAERPRLGAVLDDIDGVIDALKKRAAPTGQLEAFKQRIIDSVGAGNKSTGEIDREAQLSFRQLRDIRVTADEMAKFHPFPGMDAAPQVAMKKVRGLLEKRLMATADKFANEEGGSVLEDYKAAKAGWQAGHLLEKAAARGVAAEGTNQFYSLTDKLAGIPGAVIGHAVAGPVGAMLSHVASEHASKVIRKNFDFVVSDALAKLANVAKGEHVLTAAQKTNERIQKRIDQGLKAVTKAADGKVVEGTAFQTGPQTFEERRDQLLHVAAQHEAVLAHLQSVTSPLDRAAPSVASALQSTTLRALSYLVGELPKPPPPNPSSLTPELDQKTWEPSDAQKAKFNRKYETVVRPEEALALLATGNLTKDHVDALKATHPKMKEHMDEKLRRELDKRTKPVAPNMRPNTRLFLGVPQNDPELGRLMQSNYKPQPPQKPALNRPIKIQDNTTLNKSPRF